MVCLLMCLCGCLQTAGVLAALSQSNFPAAFKDQLASAGKVCCLTPCHSVVDHV